MKTNIVTLSRRHLELPSQFTTKFNYLIASLNTALPHWTYSMLLGLNPIGYSGSWEPPLSWVEWPFEKLTIDFRTYILLYMNMQRERDNAMAANTSLQMMPCQVALPRSGQIFSTHWSSKFSHRLPRNRELLSLHKFRELLPHSA